MKILFDLTKFFLKLRNIFHKYYLNKEEDNNQKFNLNQKLNKVNFSHLHFIIDIIIFGALFNNFSIRIKNVMKKKNGIITNINKQ